VAQANGPVDTGLEALLSAGGVPDAAGAARRLRTAFATLGEALSADRRALVSAVGVQAAALLAAAQLLHCEVAAEPLHERPLLANREELVSFLQRLIGFRPVEALVVFYLDARHRLICHQVLAEGDVGSAPLDYRRVLLHALERGATGLVLAHNHPSGDPRPSTADHRATRTLADAVHPFGITLYDHLIVSHGRTASLMH
jgi:DNA repair protein RadC